MSATLRTLMLAAVFVLLPGLTFAQPLPPGPVPVPVAPPAPPAGPPPVPPPSVPLQQPSPPGAVQPYAPPTQPYIPAAPSTGLADPGPNGWAIYGPPSCMPTYFFDAELDILKPVFKDHLQGTVTLPDGTVNTVSVPGAAAPWTVSPRLELGYKLPDSLGEFLIGYQFLVSNGSQTFGTGAGATDALSRLNLNIVDFDYNSAWYSPGPRWEMKWTVGARVAWVYYDTQISNDVLAENASTYFSGAGGHASLEVERKLGVLPALGFFAKADGAALIGTITQHFDETNFDANGNLQSSGTEVRKTQSVETLNFQIGLSYTPTEYLRFTLGYDYEHWFSLGRAGDSTGDLTTQGIFLRSRFDF